MCIELQMPGKGPTSTNLTDVKRRSTKNIGVNGTPFLLNSIRRSFMANMLTMGEGRAWDTNVMERGRDALVTISSTSGTPTIGRSSTTTHNPGHRPTATATSTIGSRMSIPRWILGFQTSQTMLQHHKEGQHKVTQSLHRMQQEIDQGEWRNSPAHGGRYHWPKIRYHR